MFMFMIIHEHDHMFMNDWDLTGLCGRVTYVLCVAGHVRAAIFHTRALPRRRARPAAAQHAGQRADHHGASPLSPLKVARVLAGWE